MKFTIDRNVWLRGEPDGSCLYRSLDGKMCCVGIYLRACNVPVEKMRDRGGVTDAQSPVPDWLLDAGGIGSEVVYQLYEVNDAADTLEAQRELEIARIFKENGVEVEFVG